MAYDPSKAAAKQVRRAQEASGDYVDGVRGVKVSPMQKAKAKKDKLKANFNASVDSGKWEAGLDGWSLEAWADVTAKKGGERYSSGVEAAREDIAAFHAEFAQHVERVKAIIDAMPDTTPEQRIQKMVANAREMGKYTRKARRR